MQQWQTIPTFYLFHKQKNWPYFIEKLLQLSENDSLELKSLGTAVDIEENKLVIDMITILTICKEFYNKIYSTVVDNLCEFPTYCSMTK